MSNTTHYGLHTDSHSYLWKFDQMKPTNYVPFCLLSWVAEIYGQSTTLRNLKQITSQTSIACELLNEAKYDEDCLSLPACDHLSAWQVHWTSNNMISEILLPKNKKKYISWTKRTVQLSYPSNITSVQCAILLGCFRNYWWIYIYINIFHIHTLEI